MTAGKRSNKPAEDFLILTAADLMQTKRLMVGIGIPSGLGLLANWILGKMERCLIPWKKGS
jgi:ABC-type nitrate/sulfonate/bicarbonate transport system permease component